MVFSCLSSATIDGMPSGFFGSYKSLREANKAKLLDSIYKFGAMTQVELAELTGLSAGTISTLVRQMADEGELTTSNTIRNGRRATQVELARQEGITIGLTISTRQLTLVILDFTRASLGEHTLPLALGHKPDDTLHRAMRLINETLDNIGAQPDEIKAIGVGLSAPVNFREKTIAVPGILPGWEGTDIVTPLNKVFHVPVFVDNDFNFAALCEARVGVAAGKKNFIYVGSSYSGVGAGIISHGLLMRGVTGMAGEIGHIQVDPLGDICACGNRGCLNTVVNERRLVSLLSITHGSLTLDSLVDKAIEGDPGCRRVISDAAVRIGTVTANLCISVDPELVVVGGTLARAKDVFTAPFAEALRRLLFPNALTPIEVVPARYLETSPARGAAIYALEHLDSTVHSPGFLQGKK